MIRLSDFKQEWCTWTQKYAFHDPEPPKLKSQIFVRGEKNSCSVLWVFNENQTKGNYHHKWTGTAQRRRWLLCLCGTSCLPHHAWGVMSLAPWQKKTRKCFWGVWDFFSCKYFWFSWVLFFFFVVIVVVFYWDGHTIKWKSHL